MPSDSLWVESRVDLFDRSETIELAERLGVSMVTAVGHLHSLWHHCMKVKPSGDVSTYGARSLAWAARWEGDADVLRDALYEGEWIDADGVIHNWGWYYDRLQHKREGNRERQQRRRERGRGVTNRELWDRDGGRCRYCGDAVTLREIHVDHVIPPHMGGEDGEENLVTACRTCTRRKFNRTPGQAGMTVLPAPGQLFEDDSDEPVGHASNALPTHSANGDESVGHVSNALHMFRGQNGAPRDANMNHALLTQSSTAVIPAINSVSEAHELGHSERGATYGDITRPEVLPMVTLDEDAPEVGNAVVTRDVTQCVTPRHAATGTGTLTGTGIESLTTQESGSIKSSASSKKTAAKENQKAERAEAAQRVYGHYKARIQPQSRVCPTDKIAKRLERFSEPELIAGIDHFADDWWRMENNVGGGYNAEWFFKSDGQVEKWVTLVPRPAKDAAGAARQPEWAQRMETANDEIPVRTLRPSTVDPHSTVTGTPSDELPVAF